MLDSEFWRDLAEQFRIADPYHSLRADWSFTVVGGKDVPETATWRVVGLGQKTRSIQYTFDSLARRCGPKIYRKMDSLVGWLEALRAERINVENESSGIDLKTDGAVLAKTYVGTIVQLCQASADLCKHYESIALEIERMESIQQIGPAPNAEASTPKLRAKRKQQTAKFPQRAAWLRQRLAEREWDHNDPPKHRGPDRKTVLKILDGGDVRESVLESLAESLSKKHSNVGLLEIPRA